MWNSGLKKMSHEIITKNESETFALGQQLAQSLIDDSVVCLFGGLGAGKTTFVRGLTSFFCDLSQQDVNSPTFTYLNIYSGRKAIYHFDLYRLKSAAEFLEMGFDEMLFANGICCIEWSERIVSILPKEIVRVEIEVLEPNVRHFRIVNGKN